MTSWTSERDALVFRGLLDAADADLAAVLKAVNVTPATPVEPKEAVGPAQGATVVGALPPSVPVDIEALAAAILRQQADQSAASAAATPPADAPVSGMVAASPAEAAVSAPEVPVGYHPVDPATVLPAGS